MSLATDAKGNDLTYRLIETALVRRHHPKRWQIACFRDASGRQPVMDYLFALTSLDDMQLICRVVQRLSYVGLGLMDTKMAKHIEGPIFELRKTGTGSCLAGTRRDIVLYCCQLFIRTLTILHLTKSRRHNCIGMIT